MYFCNLTSLLLQWPIWNKVFITVNYKTRAKRNELIHPLILLHFMPWLPLYLFSWQIAFWDLNVAVALKHFIFLANKKSSMCRNLSRIAQIYFSQLVINLVWKRSRFNFMPLQEAYLDWTILTKTKNKR